MEDTDSQSDSFENKYVTTTYSNIASQFDKSRYKIWDSTAKEIKEILNLIDSSPTVLEIGCGNGRLLKKLIQTQL